MSENDSYVYEESLKVVLLELGKLYKATDDQAEEMKELAKLLKVMNKKDKEYFSEKEYEYCKALYKKLHDAMRVNLDLQKKIIEKIREIEIMKRKGLEDA